MSSRVLSESAVSEKMEIVEADLAVGECNLV